jgi:hypothetical protein
MRPVLPLLIAFGAALAVPTHAQTVTLLDTALLAAPRLSETSGVTTSTRAGVYWTHNDSGDEPFLYATDSLGQDLGRIRVLGANAVDWEDIESGPCVVVPGRCIYIGDMGDNGARRPRVVIYRVREPEPPASAADTLRTVAVLDSLVLQYPGGPRDAESLMLTPGGTLFVVSKPRAGWSHLYCLDLHQPPPRMITDLGPLPVTINMTRGRLITGGSISPDGRWMVLRTYVSLHFFLVGGESRVTAVTDPDGIPIPVVETQGEGVEFDGPDRLILVSERGQHGHGMLTRLRLVLPTP